MDDGLRVWLSLHYPRLFVSWYLLNFVTDRPKHTVYQLFVKHMPRDSGMIVYGGTQEEVEPTYAVGSWRFYMVESPNCTSVIWYRY